MRMLLNNMLCICLMTVLSVSMKAQQTVLFPGLTGSLLRDSLSVYYEPHNVLNYNAARDSLFGSIFYRNGYVSCIYTGDSIRIYPDSALPPRTQAFNKAFNTEHTYPQSKGAGSGHARSDVHHLYPCRADVNASRGNLPFADVPDSLVERWWRLNYSQMHPPDMLEEHYSKRASFGFEVRDQKKGDAARVVFYFYTMYEDEALNADPKFFAGQIKTLRRWHSIDPPDHTEYAKNNAVKALQGNANPYIIDTTLVCRAFGVLPVKNFETNIIDETQVFLRWKKNNPNNHVLIVRNQTGIFNDPRDGYVYSNGYCTHLNGHVIITNAYALVDQLDAIGTYYYMIYAFTDSYLYSVGFLNTATTGFKDALYYWNFNDDVPEQWQQWPDTIYATTGQGFLTHNMPDAQSYKGSLLNTLENDIDGGSFVPRGIVCNQKHMILHVPSSGHKNLVLSYATRGTQTGFDTQSIFYSIDGLNYDSLTSFMQQDFDWLVRYIDFSSLYNVNDNPNFKIKIVIDGASSHSGNNRFDNYKITSDILSNNDVNDLFKTPTLKVYPNPFNEILHVRINTQKHASYQLKIFNKLGQTVYDATYSDSNISIDMGCLENGIYILNVCQTGFCFNEKLLKK